MADQKTEKTYTREDVKNFLDEIGARLADHSVPVFHSMLALNSLLGLPNARQLFDKELADQARELWRTVKTSGVQVVDPPLLFGETEEANVLLHLEDYTTESEEEGDEEVNGREPLQSTAIN